MWLHPQPLELGKNYLLKHTVRTTRAQAVPDFVTRVNVPHVRARTRRNGWG